MYIYICQTEFKKYTRPCPVERDDSVTPKHGTDGNAERICRTVGFKMQARQPAIFNVV